MQDQSQTEHAEIFAALFKENPAALVLTALDGTLLDANAKFVELLGYPREHFVGKNLYEMNFFQNWEDRDRIVDQIRTKGEAVQYEFEIADSSGTPRTLLTSAKIIQFDGQPVVLSVSLDVTDRKLLEASLREGEQDFQTLLHAAERQAQEEALLHEVRTQLARTNDLADLIRAVVEGITGNYGYTLVSLYLLEGDTLVLQHFTGYETVIRRIPIDTGISGRVIRTGKPILIPNVSEEPEFLKAAEGIQSEIAIPLFDEDNVVGTLNVESMDGFVLTEQDLNFLVSLSEHVNIAIHRARLYEQLKKSHAQHQSVLDSIDQVIFEIDAQARWKYLNPSWERLSGYPAQDCIGRSVLDFVHPDDRVTCLKSFRYVADNPGRSARGRLRAIAHDGSILWVQVDSRRSPDGAYGSFVISGTLTDITERVQAEEREHEQRRLAEALRTTAADLTTTLDMQEMLGMVIQHLREVMPSFDGARVTLVEGGIARVIRTEGYRNRSPEIAKIVIPVNAVPIWSQTVASPEAYIIPDLRTYPQRVVLPGLEWLRSICGAPLRSKDNVIGFIHLDSAQPYRFQPIHAQWLQAFADQAGTAIQNAQLYAATLKHAQELEQSVAERTAQFRQTKEQVETILNSSSDSILVLDAKGRIRKTNPAFNTMAGYKDDELHGQMLAFFAADDQRMMLAEAIDRAIREQTTEQFEVDLLRHDGTRITVEAAFDPIRSTAYEDGGLVCTLHDVTERRRIELDLRSALEQERRLVELKSRFGVTVSHEFRTPMQIIRSSVETLRYFGDQLTLNRRDLLLNRIETQIEHLGSLLEDILAISKADTIGMEFTPTPLDLNEFCRSVAEEFQNVVGHTHRVEFTPSRERIFLRADKELLRRVLNNLLTNAAKYSPNSDRIDLIVANADQHALISVRDYGIGIPFEDRDRLFETFHRASNVGTIPGTGLGLAIVKHAVDVHGGSVQVESEVGEGSTFSILLPIVDWMD